RIVVGGADQIVVALAADERVVAAVAGQQVVQVVAGDLVGELVADAVEGNDVVDFDTAEREVLDIAEGCRTAGRQRVGADADHDHRIDATGRTEEVLDLVGDAVDDVGVVAGAAV